MTDPADPGQLRNTISTQGAPIGMHEELLCGLMEGVQTLKASGQFAGANPWVVWEATYHGGNPTTP